MTSQGTIEGGAPLNDGTPGRRPWPADSFQPMVCRAAYDETADVRTFVLEPLMPSRIAFSPGQSFAFRMDVGGTTLERCYSVASSSAVETSIEITVKRKDGGRFTAHLFDRLKPGVVIEAMGPNGSFTPADHSAGKYLLLSAGSGITPMASIVRSLADRGSDADIVFLHGARSPADVIFADEFARLRRRLPGLRIHVATSRAAPDGDSASHAGRIDAARLGALVPDLAERIVFCCGPQGFMAAMRGFALQAGVAAERFVEESFDFGEVDTPPIAPVEPPAQGVVTTVTFVKSGRSFACAPGSTILEAARKAGVPMPSSCTKGLCGTCKTMKISGTVQMNHAGGIRQREIDKGLILPCCSRPDSDVVLDR